MKAKIYTVFIGFNGYDVNTLVKATSPKKAKEFAMKNLDFLTSVHVVDDKFIKEMDVEKDVKKLMKKKVGATYVYDEGT